MKRQINRDKGERKHLKINSLPKSLQDQYDSIFLNDEEDEEVELVINEDELKNDSEFRQLFYNVGDENPDGTTSSEIERLDDDEAKIKEVANLINKDVGVEVPTDMDIEEDDDMTTDIDWFVPDWKKKIKIEVEPTMRSEGLIFQEIKTEYVTKKSKRFRFDYPGPKGVQVPVVQMYGITENRKSVLCNIWGFQPYFYIDIPQSCKLTPKQIIQKIEHENKIRVVRKILNKRMVDSYKIILSERDERDNNSRYSVRLMNGKMFDIIDNEAGMFDDEDDDKEIQVIKRKINYAFQIVKCVHEYHFVEKTSVWHHQHDKKKKFLKVFTYIPSNVRAIREIIDPKELSDVISYKGQPFKFQTYESNVVFTLRCMTNKGIKPATWIEVKNFETSLIKESHCDIEIDISCDDIVGKEPKGKFEKIAPYCILSFDIECYGNVDEKNKSKKVVRFPKADIKKCKVTQIANAITIGKNTVIKNCFTLGTCADIDKSIGDVYCFKSERQLLMAWRKFVLKIDPDIITGYNIIAFDLPYLFNRAKYLDLPDFPLLGRIKKKVCYHRVQEKGSKQTGRRLTTDITMYGRNVVDVMNFTILFKYPKLASYTLNYVAHSYLGDQKEDVHYSMIPTLQDTSKNTRKRLVTYCIKDALLPQQIMNKQTLIERITEISRVTGVQLEWVIERGQQIRVFSQLLRFANKLDYIIPAFRIQEFLDKFKGATVKEPMKGFHKNPIVTLDFASLYPSIMIDKNLCYTTYIPPHKWHMYTRDQYVITPVGHRFVKAHIKRGFLPEILKGLLSARSKAKKEMYSETDKARIAVLNGRQLALKVSANSVYGFTGAGKGMLPLRPISESVTAYGRKMIEDTTNWVEYKFRKGAVIYWPEDLTFKDGSHEELKKIFEGRFVMNYVTKVIYGDTDSVMIDFGPYDRKTVWALAYLAEYYVAKELYISDIIKLGFEKIFHPYLLISKKNYAGLHFEKYKWEKAEKLNSKGIEVVRRDKAAFVREGLKKTLDLIFEPFSVYPVRDITEGAQNGYNYLCQIVSDILERRLPFDKYIITKRISKKIRHGNEERLCYLINQMFEGSFNEDIVREEISKILMDDDTLKKNKSHWRYILTLLEDQQVPQMRNYLKKILRNCENDFKLGGYYKTKTTHSELTKMMKKRDPGSEAKLGDRVKFVYVAKGMKAKAFEMGEDPIFALKNDIPIDIHYYLVNKFMPVILNRFSPIFTVEQLYSIFSGYMKIYSRMNKQELKRIQIPLHPIKITIRKNKRALKIVQAPVQSVSRRSIGFYFKKKEKCVNCKKYMVKTDGLCVNCLPDKIKIHSKFELEKMRINEEIYSIAKTCRECQGEDLEQVPCSNDDCPLFYQKYQVKKKMQLCKKKFEALDW